MTALDHHVGLSGSVGVQVRLGPSVVEGRQASRALESHRAVLLCPLGIPTSPDFHKISFQVQINSRYELYYLLMTAGLHFESAVTGTKMSLPVRTGLGAGSGSCNVVRAFHSPALSS